MMQVAETIYRSATLLVIVVLIAAFLYGMHGVYYAYIQKKDERQKYIVLRSAAQAFSLSLIYYTLDMIALFSMNDGLYRFWRLLNFRIESDTPMPFMIVLFGLCLLINKRKAGGA